MNKIRPNYFKFVFGNMFKYKFIVKDKNIIMPYKSKLLKIIISIIFYLAWLFIFIAISFKLLILSQLLIVVLFVYGSYIGAYTIIYFKTDFQIEEARHEEV